MKSDHRELGRKGESIAAEYLASNGYQILHSNWRYRKTEVDLIAQWGSILVFVEVKSRTSDFFGDPESFVTERKEMLLQEAAAGYMELHQYDGEIRFDIIGILFQSDYSYRITHYPDAFF